MKMLSMLDGVIMRCDRAIKRLGNDIPLTMDTSEIPEIIPVDRCEF